MTLKKGDSLVAVARVIADDDSGQKQLELAEGNGSAPPADGPAAADEPTDAVREEASADTGDSDFAEPGDEDVTML